MKGMIKFLTAVAFVAAAACCLCACAAGNQPSASTDETGETGGTIKSDETSDEDPTFDIDGFEEEGEDGAGDNAVVNESGIKHFRYSYNGSIGGNDYYYEVRTEDEGSIIFECEFMEYDYGTMSMEVSEDVLDELNDIYLEQKIARWDGYNKYAPYVDDGDGFTLNIEFNDEGYLNAYGSNCWPEGYSKFESSIEEILRPLAEKLMEEGRQQKISEGVSGELTGILVNFIQHGDSGDDSYQFFINRQGVRDKNFDVRITSESGEFFEPGTYNYYFDLPDEAVNFGGIKELIEKYDIIRWYGYDESAEDYANSEWFQISFSFDRGQIAAMGTEHPEYYDEFRHDFLTLMAEVIKNAESEYGLENRKIN